MSRADHPHTSITEYLSKTNVQLGASYRTGTQSSSKYEHGYQAAAKYINAGRDEIGTHPHPHHELLTDPPQCSAHPQRSSS